MNIIKRKTLSTFIALMLLVTLVFPMNLSYASNGNNMTGAIFTTDEDGDRVNKNIYDLRKDVYLNGGPDKEGAAGLPDGSYYVRVTDPSGKLILGKSEGTVVEVVYGEFEQLYQLWDIVYSGESNFEDKGYDLTENPGGEYKVWVSQSSSFEERESKTDNFKVRECNEPQEPETGCIKIIKTIDSEDGDPQPNVTFTISKDEFNIPGVTDEDGIILFSDLEPGEYTVTEDIPEGYTTSLDDDASVTVVAGQTIPVYVVNTLDDDPQEPETGSIKIIKTIDCKEGKPQPNVTFTITKGELVKSGKTGVDGTILFSDLELGNYIVTETVPDGFTTNLPDDYSATVVAGQTTPVYVVNTRDDDPQEPETGCIKIIKTIDSIEGEPQQDITFTISMGEFSISAETGEDGTILFSDLDPGDYAVTESVPDGFITDLPDDYSATVIAGQTTPVYVVNTRDDDPQEPKTGSIKIFKTIKDGGAQRGITFNISSGDFSTSGSTGEDGTVLFSDLDPGDYTVTESVPDGFTTNLPDDYSATVIAGETTFVYVVNTRDDDPQQPETGSIKIFKTIKDGGAQRGITFNISKDEFSTSGVTDEYGVILFSDLDPGDYTVTESVPDGYTTNLPDDYSATVVAGETTFVYVVNTRDDDPDEPSEPEKGSIKIIKTIDSEDGDPQEGVTFEITKGTYKKSKVTDSKGIAKFSELKTGIYTVKEIVPEGYTTNLPDSYTVTVKEGKTSIIKVVNTLIEDEDEDEDEDDDEDDSDDNDDKDENDDDTTDTDVGGICTGGDTENNNTNTDPTNNESSECNQQTPDLPNTGGAVELEMILSGLGSLLLASGIVLKRKKR